MCCCAEGLEEVTLEEMTQLGGDARIVGDGLVLVAASSSMPPNALLHARTAETFGILVGGLTLSGEASDVEAFKMLCHPTLGPWRVGAKARWEAAATAWVAARRAAVTAHGLGLGEDKEGPVPSEEVRWDAVCDEDVRVGPDGRLELKDDGGGSTVVRRDDGASGASEQEQRRMSFRVSCVRHPGSAEGGIKHAYKSVDVNHELGWGIGATHPAWRVDLTRATLTVEVTIKGKLAAVTLQAAAAADARRMRRVEATATTRPHLAAAMVRLAKPALGEVVVDLGCGMGTIMSEAAQHNCVMRDPRRGSPREGSRGGETIDEASTTRWGDDKQKRGGGRVVLGGDVEPDSASLAVDNLAAAGPSLCYDVCAWSMTHLPLRSASQDIVTCDLPFGKAHLDAKTISRLYPAALREACRVLRVGGRAVMMGMRAKFNNILLNDALPLEIRYQRLIDKGGLKVALYVLERVDEAEWERRKAAGGGVTRVLKKSRRSEEHMAKSRERAAARLARGEDVGIKWGSAAD